MKIKSVQSINLPSVAGKACQSAIKTIYDIVMEDGRALKTKEGEVSDIFIKLF